LVELLVGAGEFGTRGFGVVQCSEEIEHTNTQQYDGDRKADEGVEGGAAINTEDTGANKFLEIIKNMEMTKRAG
jgi:hypothetical protein